MLSRAPALQDRDVLTSIAIGYGRRPAQRGAPVWLDQSQRAPRRFYRDALTEAAPAADDTNGAPTPNADGA